MMKNEIRYRLSEYVIIEHSGIMFTWESQIALGQHRSGRCFIIGNILVIGPAEQEEAGFLKLEFSEQLMKLPAWAKTKYYCFASSIRKIGTEQSIMNQLIENPFIFTSDKKTVNKVEPGCFRLGSYKVTVNENSIIFWEITGEHNKTSSGKCIIESDILFIGPKENETGGSQNRKNFLASLKLLTQWNQTVAWGYYGSLRKCTESTQKTSYTPIGKLENVKAQLTDKILSRQYQQFSNNRPRECAATKSEYLKTIWLNIVEWKIWGYLADLVISSFLLVLRFIMFLLRNLISISQRILSWFHARKNNRKGFDDK